MTNQADFAVIFDMDGVLIDTVQPNWQAHNEVLAAYGVHVRDDQLFEYIGRALDDQVAMINRRFKVQIDPREFETQIAPIQARMHAHVEPKEGVISLIEQLQDLCVPIAVGTSTPREAALTRLKTAELLQYFEVIATRDEVERHKPDPSVYLYAARQLAMQPVRCVVIEDAPTGVEAAHAAHMKCVAVETTYVPPRMMHQADLLIPSLDQVSPKELEALL